MKIRSKVDNDIVIIYIHKKELLSIDGEEIIDIVNDYLRKEKESFVIDLQNVKYIDSSGINLLIGVLTLIRNKGGELVLTTLSDKIKNLLIITKLNSIFNVKKSVEESVGFFEDIKKVV